MQLKKEVRSISNKNLEIREEQITSQREEFNFQYYQEYKRLYQTAFLLSLQLKQLTKSKEELGNKLDRLEKKTQDFKDDIRGELPDRKKRYRRTAQQIQRNYICQMQKCKKCYGSQGSLQQHIKLKHPEIYQNKLIYKKQQDKNEKEEVMEYYNQFR